mgnify:FL=1
MDYAAVIQDLLLGFLGGLLALDVAWLTRKGILYKQIFRYLSESEGLRLEYTPLIGFLFASTVGVGLISYCFPNIPTWTKIGLIPVILQVYTPSRSALHKLVSFLKQLRISRVPSRSKETVTRLAVKINPPGKRRRPKRPPSK